jgi:hypothetical protein
VRVKLNALPLHPKQLELKNLATEKKPGEILVAHGVAGGGAGKTIAGIRWVLDSMLTYNAGMPHLWTAPTYPILMDSFFETWCEMVPYHLYKYVGGTKKTITLTNGSVLKLRTRKDPESLRGPSVAGVVLDEIGVDRTRKAYDLCYGRIRDTASKKAGQLWLLTITTPKMGWHQQERARGDAPAVHWSLLDNPYADPRKVEQYKRVYSEEFYNQEVLGQDIAQEGRVWKSFSEEEWPKGNMHWAEWDPDRDWYLGMDLGQGIGHWQIVQYHDPINRHGDLEYRDNPHARLAVVVAEGLQHKEDIHPVLNLIAENYAADRRPIKVAAGADVKNLGPTGPDAAQIIRKRGWEVWWPKGTLVSKGIQGNNFAGLICNTIGERRYCISQNIKRHGPSNRQWGILNCMLTDEWPEPGSSDKYRKDKGVAGIGNCEDPRDSGFYLMTHNHRPSWAESDRWAA